MGRGPQGANTKKEGPGCRAGGRPHRRGRSHGQRHSPERVGGQLAARQAQVPKRPGAAEEELQCGGRSPGLPGAGEREEWA